MTTMAWSWFWRLAGAVKVRWKIMGIVVAVILLLGGSVTYELAVSYKKTLQDQIEEKGLSMGRSLAARATNLVLTDQRFALFELAKEIQESSEDVEYVYIVDKSGMPVVDTFGSGFPRDLLSLPGPESGDPYRVTRLSTQGGVVQDIAVPILQGRGGTAHIGMSEARIQQFVNEHVRTNVLIIVGVLIVGAVGAFALATILTRPVEKLVEATEAIGQGEYHARAPVWASDEIGKLGVAFNSMAAQLQRSSESLLQRNRDLEGLNALASAANRSQEVHVVMESALALIATLTQTRASWIALLEEDEDVLQTSAQTGLSKEEADQLLTIEARRCHCLSTSAANGGQPVDVRYGCPVVRARLPESLLPASVTCMPLRSQGRPLGVLNVVHASEDEPDKRERLLLLAIADQVGIAIENARLVAELRRKDAIRGQLLEKVITAQEDERKRISRELHDDTGQALTALAVTLRSMESLPLADEDRGRLAGVQALAANALRAVHDLAMQLRPSILDEVGLGPALEHYVESFSERYRIATDVQVIGMKTRLPAATETALYRIAQEALTNVARHSQASHASVLLEGRDERVLLLVEDDGCGFTRTGPDPALPEHLGIHGMEERAMLVGGTLTIESRPGSGTSVYADVPVEEEANV